MGAPWLGQGPGGWNPVPCGGGVWRGGEGAAALEDSEYENIGTKLAKMKDE